MRRIDGVIGNVGDDPELADRIDAHESRGTLERVVLAAIDRKKSRLRATTDAGTDLGILVDEPQLRAGDVLAVDDEGAILVAFRSREAFVVDLPAPTEETLIDAVELGHRIGNQHWDVAVRDGAIHVPVAADRRIIENVLEEYLPSDADVRYEEVDAELFLNDENGHTHAGGDTGGHTHAGGDTDGHVHHGEHETESHHDATGDRADHHAGHDHTKHDHHGGDGDE